MARKPFGAPAGARAFERSAKDRKSDRTSGLKEGSPAEEAQDQRQSYPKGKGQKGPGAGFKPFGKGK